MSAAGFEPVFSALVSSIKGKKDWARMFKIGVVLLRQIGMKFCVAGLGQVKPNGIYSISV